MFRAPDIVSLTTMPTCLPRETNPDTQSWSTEQCIYIVFYCIIMIVVMMLLYLYCNAYYHVTVAAFE